MTVRQIDTDWSVLGKLDEADVSEPNERNGVGLGCVRWTPLWSSRRSAACATANEQRTQRSLSVLKFALSVPPELAGSPGPAVKTRDTVQVLRLQLKRAAPSTVG